MKSIYDLMKNQRTEFAEELRQEAANCAEIFHNHRNDNSKDDAIGCYMEIVAELLLQLSRVTFFLHTVFLGVFGFFLGVVFMAIIKRILHG